MIAPLPKDDSHEIAHLVKANHDEWWIGEIREKEIHRILPKYASCYGMGVSGLGSRIE